ncbi:MAG: class I SAM-dependent methyltransferase [Thermosynechococcaceae cyanobacterium]
MITKQQENLNSKILSHQNDHDIEKLKYLIEEYKRKIIEAGDKTHVTVEQQLQFIDKLLEFPLGEFILTNRGTNGYWTDYMIEHQYHNRFKGTDTEGRQLTPLEKIFLDRFPMVVATQQRAVHFSRILQSHVREEAVMASLPCGLMRDLLALDFSGVKNFKLVGIDIDDQSLNYAKNLAEEYHLSFHVELYQYDAWNQPFENYFTVLTSNGLSVYEPDDDRVTDLYRQFFKALKPGGTLVTSFITPSPDMDPNSEWNMDAIDWSAMLQQKLLYTDILNFNPKGLRSSTTTKTQLSKVGFENLELIWDEAQIFPTIIAHKPQ